MSTQTPKQNLTLQQAMNIAMQHHKAGNLEKAEVVYKQLMHSLPDEPAVLHLYGLLESQQGHHKKAEKLILKAINIKPDFDEAHNNLANMFIQLGRLEDAITHYQKALAIKPDSAETHYNLAIALQENNGLDQALLHFNKAIAIKPDFAEAHINLGNLYQGENQLDKAINHYSEAIKIAPGVAEVESSLATSLKGLGRLEQALVHFQKVLDIDPGYTEAFRQITSIRKQKSYDDEIKKMESMITDADLDEQQQMHLAFGLGKVFEDLQEFEKSFRFYSKGNAIKRNGLSFDIETWKDYISKQINVFNQDLFEQFKLVGSGDSSPIFVIGMPRSGTTLVEQILASHKDVYGGGEQQTLSQILAANFKMADYPQDIQNLNGSIFELLGNKYIAEMRENANAAQYVTDKMTGNYIHIGMIKLLMPNAKIIHCRRDPKDNCLSIFKNYFSSLGHQYAYDQLELAEFYNQYQRLMDHWQRVLPDFIYNVQYESLIDDQKGQTSELLKFCGLDWDDDCVNFHQADRIVQTASATQMRKPVNSDSVELRRSFEKHLTPLFQGLDCKK